MASSAPPAPRATRRVCECCGKEGARKRCARCLESFYCSLACQTEHWKAGHKAKCVKAVKAAKPVKAAARAAAAATAQGGGGSARTGGRGGGGDAGDEECAICLDELQQPQTMPCGHRFCRGCVAGMRQHGISQVCPLCRGPMPDAERLLFEASRMLTQFERWETGTRQGSQQAMPGAPKPPWVRELLREAVGVLREARAISPEVAHVHIELGYALDHSGDQDGALSAWGTATALDPHCHCTVHYNMACILKKRGDMAGAEAAHRAALVANPTFANAHGNLGNILLSRGDLCGAAAAEPHFRAAIANDPGGAVAPYGLGQCLERRGDSAGAIAAWRAAISADPQFVHAYNALGRLLGKTGDHASAAAVYTRLVKIAPSFPHALERLIHEQKQI